VRESVKAGSIVGTTRASGSSRAIQPRSASMSGVSGDEELPTTFSVNSSS
jgi:hypothetical protein